MNDNIKLCADSFFKGVKAQQLEFIKIVYKRQKIIFDSYACYVFGVD